MRIIGYILWFISLGISIYLLLYARGFYLKILSFLLHDYWWIAVWDKILFILLVFLVFGIIIFLESFYLKKDTKNLFRRFLMITGVQIIILFFFQILTQLILGINPSFKESLLWFTELLLAGIFVRSYFSSSSLK